MDEKLLETLRKKALGYTVSEQITEYDAEGNEIKQKITTKDVPPDLSAIKLLLEMTEDEELTEAELEQEKRLILAELTEYYKDGADAPRNKPAGATRKEKKNGNQ